MNLKNNNFKSARGIGFRIEDDKVVFFKKTKGMKKSEFKKAKPLKLSGYSGPNYGFCCSKTKDDLYKVVYYALEDNKVYKKEETFDKPPRKFKVYFQ